MKRLLEDFLFLKYSKKNYFSQSGEDGIIVEILDRLSQHITLDGWCSEFGAWDGIHLSNTCYLIKERNYKAVLIEGDSEKVKELKNNFPQNEVAKVHRFVSFEGSNSLDSIYSEYDIPRDFDFLSIDIDGVDYHIFESLKKFKPKVICIEFNPAIPNAVDYVQAKDMGVKHGSSAKAIVRLADEKGYVLAAVTHCNLILVDEKFADLAIEERQSLEVLNPNGNDGVYIFGGYDGTILSNKEHVRLGWHGIVVPMSQLQFLPRFFRKYYGDYGVVRRWLFLLFVGFRMPLFALRHKDKAIEILKKEWKRIYR